MLLSIVILNRNKKKFEHYKKITENFQNTEK